MKNGNSSIAMLLPSLEGGGAERVMTTLAGALAERGFQVAMVLFRAVGPFLEQLSPKVRVVDLKTGRAAASVLPLARYLRREKPDVLLPALDHANVAALAARWLASTRSCVVPCVHATHSKGIAHGGKPIAMRLAMRLFYRRADAVVTVSQGAADDMVRTTGVPAHLVRVIYNPVITPRLREISQQPPDHPWFAPGQPPAVLAVGNLSPAKDYATLLQGFSLLRRARDARLVVLGEGPERVPLERLVRELGLAEVVSMPGFVTNPYAYMAKCALYVLSSAWEALPTVLIEALALGAPVVATDCQNGPREILQDGRYGPLVPVGDATALARAMGAALDGPPPEVPATVLLPYTVDAAADRYAEVIAEVLHARRTGGRRP
jgi:glycosyltransferase involved in cell wall biosynthesis